MSSEKLETILFWIVRVGAYILPFTLLVVVDNLFFPFVSGKNFLFRIIVEFMAAGWLGLLIINFRKYWPRWGVIGIAFTVFVGAIFVSAFFGVNFKHSFWSNFERMEGLVTHLHLLTLFFVLAGTFRTRREWFILFGVSIAVSVMVGIYGLLEFTGEIFNFSDGLRIISTLGNPLYVAAYLSFHIFLIAFLWPQMRSVPLKLILGAVFLFELVMFFLTGARGAFVGILAGSGIILFLLAITTDGVKRRIVFFGIILILLLIPILLYMFRDAPVVRDTYLLSRFSYITLEAGKARFTLWGMAFDAFKERPVFGWGAENFIVPYAKHYDPRMFGQEAWFDRTHNMFMEWLVAGGAVGFLAYLALLGSIIPALRRGVGRGLLQKKSAFIFVGMIVAYLIQLLFVFDTLATYLMLVIVLGFLHVASIQEGDKWLRKNTIGLSSGAILPESSEASWLQSRKERRESQRRLNKTVNHLSLSQFSVGMIVVIYFLFFLLAFFINIQPLAANAALINSFALFSQQQFSEAQVSFQKALKLSKGTIGTAEIREHIVFNVYNLFSSPELLQKPEAAALYRLATDEMEKQVAEEAGKYLEIKHNILLAQLYHQYALATGDRLSLTSAFREYDKALQFAPNYISVYPIAANLYVQAGDAGEAIRLIEKAVSLLTSVNKFDENIFYSRVLFYAAAKRYDEAYSALAEISARYTNPPGKLNKTKMENIVFSTRAHGRDALPFLEKVSALDQSLSWAPLMLAQINALLGEKEQAKFYAGEALKRDLSIERQINEFLKELGK